MEYLPDIERFLTMGVALIAAIGSIHNARKIKEVHISINSRMDQLLTATGQVSEAKGLAEGRAETRELPDDRAGNGLLDKLKR